MDIEDYLSALAGPAMSWLANKQVSQQQNAINNQSAGYKLGQSSRAMDATGNLISGTVAPAAVMANDAAAKATLAKNLTGTIAANKSYEVGPNYGGKVTGDYSKRFDSNNADIADRIQRSIDQFSTINAPAVRRQGDAVKFATTGNTVAGANSASKAVGNQYDAAMGTVRPNPLLSFGAQLANGFNLARAQKRATLFDPASNANGVADSSTYANNDWMSA